MVIYKDYYPQNLPTLISKILDFFVDSVSDFSYGINSYWSKNLWVSLRENIKKTHNILNLFYKILLFFFLKTKNIITSVFDENNAE